MIIKRKQFIEKYCSNRNFEVVGSRDLIMFLYCVCLVQFMSVDFVMSSMKKLNKQFNEPLEQSKLDSIFNYMQKKGFLKFRQETFLNFLPDVISDERKKYLSNSEQNAQKVGCSVRTVKSFLKDNNFNRSDYLKSQIVQLVAQGLSLI